MTLQQLRLLQAVVDHGGFRRAAAALGQSQSALTRQIARLEEDLGQPLLLRSPARRGVALTAAGKIVLRQARVVLGAFAAMRSDLSGLEAGSGGPLTVGVTCRVGVELVRRAAELVREYSQKAVVSALMVGPEFGAQLKTGELDLVITLGLPASLPSYLERERLFDDRLCVVAGPDLAGKLADRRALGELMHESWVFWPGLAPAAIDHLLPWPNRHAPRSMIVAEGAEAELEQIHAGRLGVWSGASLALRRGADVVPVLTPLTPRQPVNAVRLRDRPASPEAQALARAMRRLAGEIQGSVL